MNKQQELTEKLNIYVESDDILGFLGEQIDFINTDYSIDLKCKCVETTNEYDFDGLPELTSVFYFEDYDLYVKFEGYYKSYSGTSFRQFYFVTPKEITTTIYE